MFSILFLASLATASPSLNLQHEDIQAGETILATITTQGEFSKQISTSDIKFFEGRKDASFEYDILYYDNTHYLYVYTTRSGNFSMEIQNILYKENGQLDSITITTPLNISDATDQVLSIKPGFIFTTTSAEIRLINKGTVNLTVNYGENETILEPLKTEQIEIFPEETISNFAISTYKEFSVPIIYTPLFKNDTNETLVEILQNKSELKYNPAILVSEIFVGDETQETIQLFNFGDENITSIEISSDLEFIEFIELTDFTGREAKNLTLNLAPKSPGHFQGFINISYVQYENKSSISIPLSIFVLPQGSEPEEFTLGEETCEEMSGVICEAGFVCEGNATFTKGGEYCCLATCKEVGDGTPEDEGGKGWAWALMIFIFLGLGAYYFYQKQKKIQPPKSEDTLKKFSEDFQKRMAGKSKRVSGTLSKS